MKYFNTLTGFFNDTEKTVSDGDIIVTAGYSTVNDGGAGTYVVTLVTADESASGIVISGKTFTKGDTQLELIADSGEVNVEQFGASSAASAAVNKTAIQAAVESGARRVNFRPVQYLVADDIVINHPVDIVGNGAQLVLETDSTSTQLFRVEYAENTDPVPASIKDMKISGTYDESEDVIYYYNTLINFVNAMHFTISDVYFEYGSSAIETTNSSTQISDINIVNCVFRGFVVGISFMKVEGFKIKNCNIDLLDDNGSTGLSMNSNVKSGIVEDVTIINALYAAIDYWSAEWSKTVNDVAIKDATDRVVFKNLNIENSLYGIRINYSDVPIGISNAMITEVAIAVYLDCAKNISVTHSSISLLSPSKAPEDAVPVYMSCYAHAEFKHVQFEFPWVFQNSEIYDADEVSDIKFVDCTIQKTDITGVEGVISSKGFGNIGSSYVTECTFNETFDACEFRSYIQNYSTDNIPVTLSTLNNSDSKLIIKNCRFVNENSCTVPYFKLDDSAKYDNIVVYNCFFENYNYTDPNAPSVYPIFGRVVNGTVTPSNEDADGAKIHNIFARCNMRSSEPTRNSGTTINEMKEYL